MEKEKPGKNDDLRIVEEVRQSVRTEGDVLRARQVGRAAAERLGFDGIRTATVEIVISELGLNLVKHKTVEGVLLIRVVKAGSAIGLEIVSEDKGPGMADSLHAMEDGASTAGSLGIGLPGVRRMVDEFKLEPALPLGTRIRARKWLRREPFPRFGFSVFNRPMPGERESGDTFFLKQYMDYSMFGIVDALGHGPHAHAVAKRALAYLESCFEARLEDIFAGCHAVLQGSRGAAMALARLDNTSLRMEHLSVGNIETRLYSPKGVARLCGRYGTLGLSYSPISATSHVLERRTALVMFSDGLNSSFELSPSILLKSEQEIAWHLFENHARRHDDATVIVAKMRS